MGSIFLLESGILSDFVLLQQENMKIGKFKIEDLHKQFTFESELHKNVNILVGNNGSFKSTLLYVLYYMLQSKKMRGIYNFSNASVDLCEPNATVGYRSMDGSLADFQEKAKTEATIADMVDAIQKKFSGDKILNITFGMEQYGYSLNGEECSEEDFKKLVKTDFISTFDIKERTEDGQSSLLDRMLEKLQSEYSYYLSDLAKEMTDIINKEGRISKECLDGINRQKNLMIQFVNESFSKTGKEIVSDQGKLLFRFENGHTIDVKALSAGEKQLLMILLTILLEREQDYIVFLDEPEISLHIDWQYKLIEMLTRLNPNAQFVLTTHSPGIFADGWGNKIIYMEDITHNQDEE